MDLYLASKSPRRSKILTEAGFKFTVITSPFDERSVELSKNPKKGVSDIALGKATAAYKELPSIAKLGSVVLGADTIVVCDGEVLQKPDSPDEARQMLKKLSGRKHEVYTAVAIVNVMSCEVMLESTDVWFYDLTDEEIDGYIKTGEPMDKAGAYGIQGKGSLLVKRIDGDYFNVVGLPIAKTARKLKDFHIESAI